MNHLIVYAHRIPKVLIGDYGYFCTALRVKGHDVRIRDLYKLQIQSGFNKSEMERIQKGPHLKDLKASTATSNGEYHYLYLSDWWAGAPAILKGYLERS